MGIGEKTLEEKSEQLSIKTKKYQAIPLKNTDEPKLFVVNTARKSRIRASNLCASCGVQVGRQDITRCQLCDKKICKNCLEENNEELICAACKKGLAKGEDLDSNG